MLMVSDEWKESERMNRWSEEQGSKVICYVLLMTEGEGVRLNGRMRTLLFMGLDLIGYWGMGCVGMS